MRFPARFRECYKRARRDFNRDHLFVEFYSKKVKMKTLIALVLGVLVVMPRHSDAAQPVFNKIKVWENGYPHPKYGELLGQGK